MPPHPAVIRMDNMTQGDPVTGDPSIAAGRVFPTGIAPHGRRRRALGPAARLVLRPSSAARLRPADGRAAPALRKPAPQQGAEEWEEF